MDNYIEIRKLAGLLETIDLGDKRGFTSLNLFNEMAVIQTGLLNKLQEGLQWLKNNNIHAVVIGGAAVVHYISGARSLTPDVDFLVQNFLELTTKLRQEGLQFTPIVGTRYGGGSIGITVPEFDVDFLNPQAGNPAINNYILQTAKSGKIGGGNFLIASPEALAISKFDIGRDKDDTDAFLLLQSGVVNRQEFIKAVKALRGSLSDYESVKMYAQMIK